MSGNNISTPAPEQAAGTTPAPATTPPVTEPTQRVSTPAPVTPPAPAPTQAEAPVEPAQSGVSRIRSLIGGTMQLQNQVQDLAQQLHQAQLREQQLATQVQDLTQQLTDYRALEQELSGDLAQSQQRADTVAAAAADQLATLGVAAKDLPAQQASGSDFETRYQEARQKGGGALMAFLKENDKEAKQFLTKA